MRKGGSHKAQGKLSVVFEFTPYGLLRGIFLSAENEDDQKVLQKGLSNLLKPEKFNLLRALFKRDENEH